MKAFERHYTVVKEFVNEIDWEGTTSMFQLTKNIKIRKKKRFV